MEPAFFRGDILFLWLGDSPFKVWLLRLSRPPSSSFCFFFSAAAVLPPRDLGRSYPQCARASICLTPVWRAVCNVCVVKVGEIIVFKVKGRDIPIVHRIIEVHEL
jgi:hypothetical protein